MLKFDFGDPAGKLTALPRPLRWNLRGPGLLLRGERRGTGRRGKKKGLGMGREGRQKNGTEGRRRKASPPFHISGYAATALGGRLAYV